MHKSGMRIRAPLMLFVVVSATLAGCAEFPALDQTITPALEQADYPALVPLGPLLAETAAPHTDRETTQARMDARLAALRARAARLRDGVLSGRERQRLAQGLQ